MRTEQVSSYAKIIARKMIDRRVKISRDGLLNSEEVYNDFRRHKQAIAILARKNNIKKVEFFAPEEYFPDIIISVIKKMEIIKNKNGLPGYAFKMEYASGLIKLGGNKSLEQKIMATINSLSTKRSKKIIDSMKTLPKKLINFTKASPKNIHEFSRSDKAKLIYDYQSQLEKQTGVLEFPNPTGKVKRKWKKLNELKTNLRLFHPDMQRNPFTALFLPASRYQEVLAHTKKHEKAENMANLIKEFKTNIDERKAIVDVFTSKDGHKVFRQRFFDNHEVKYTGVDKNYNEIKQTTKQIFVSSTEPNVVYSHNSSKTYKGKTYTSPDGHTVNRLKIKDFITVNEGLDANGNKIKFITRRPAEMDSLGFKYDFSSVRYNFRTKSKTIMYYSKNPE